MMIWTLTVRKDRVGEDTSLRVVASRRDDYHLFPLLARLTSIVRQMGGWIDRAV